MAQLLLIAMGLAIAFYAVAAVVLAIPLWLPAVAWARLPESIRSNTHARTGLATLIIVIAVPYVPFVLETVSG